MGKDKKISSVSSQNNGTHYKNHPFDILSLDTIMVIISTGTK